MPENRVSRHLDDVIKKYFGSTNVLVVFLDIVKYSKRTSRSQQNVINSFSSVLKTSLDEISSMYVKESQLQDLNLNSDIIRIPTGDGAAIVFAFGGHQSIHLDFATSFLKNCYSSRHDENCEKFTSQGWCNCHDFFDVRIGASEGRCIVYKDVNDNYNVAGNAINIASRIMSLCDKQTILFSDEAYKNLIDMAEDTTIENRFNKYSDIRIKHDVLVDVYQYVGDGENYINRETPEHIEVLQKTFALSKDVPSFSINMNNSQRLQYLKVMESLKDIPSSFGFVRLMNDVANGARTEADLEKFIEAFKLVGSVMGEKTGSGNS